MLDYSAEIVLLLSHPINIELKHARDSFPDTQTSLESVKLRCLICKEIAMKSVSRNKPPLPNFFELNRTAGIVHCQSDIRMTRANPTTHRFTNFVTIRGYLVRVQLKIMTPLCAKRWRQRQIDAMERDGEFYTFGERVVSWVEWRTVNFVGLGTKDMKFNRSVYQKQILIITIHR